MRLPHVARPNVGVDLRGTHTHVTQHGLHTPQIGSTFEQVGGEAVSQEVRVGACVDAGGSRVAPHDPLNGGR
jgi:hypothetical protein